MPSFKYFVGAVVFCLFLPPAQADDKKQMIVASGEAATNEGGLIKDSWLPLLVRAILSRRTANQGQYADSRKGESESRTPSFDGRRGTRARSRESAS